MENVFENHDFGVEFMFEVESALNRVENDPTYSINDAQNYLKGWVNCLQFNNLIDADEYIDLKLEMYNLIYEFENEKEN